MNITRKTEEYLQKHWLLREAIRKNIANNSELARLVAKELGLSPVRDFHAVLVACRRYAETLKSTEREQKIIALLKKSKLNVKNKLARIIVTKDTKLNAIHFIRGENTNTAIIEESDLEKIRHTYKHNILDIKKGLVEVLLISPKQIEETIGVSAYLTSLFADAEINVYTLTGSYNEDIFIIEQKDITKALELLSSF